MFAKFVQTVGGLILILAVVDVFAYFVPDPFIWLLGPKYVNMRGLIWLVILSAGVGQVAGAIFGLNMIKGWIPPAIVTIPIELVTQVVLFMCLDVSKIQNVLLFATLTAVPPMILNTVILIRRIRMEPD